MSLTLHYLSGSPYAWRVWLALAHKGLEPVIHALSMDAGDFKSEAFGRLNPRRRVPVLEHGGFALYESAAIVEYIEDQWPAAPRLFAADPRQRALQRRMIREADQYVATELEHLVEAVLFTPPPRRDPARIRAAWTAMARELVLWESAIAGEFLAGDLSAVDYTLYPELALARRIATRNPDLGLDPATLLGPRMTAWDARMTGLPIVQATWPPHWKG